MNNKTYSVIQFNNIKPDESGTVDQDRYGIPLQGLSFKQAQAGVKAAFKACVIDTKDRIRRIQKSNDGSVDPIINLHVTVSWGIRRSDGVMVNRYTGEAIGMEKISDE